MAHSTKGLRGPGRPGWSSTQVYPAQGNLGEPGGQTEFQVNLELGLTPRTWTPRTWYATTLDNLAGLCCATGRYAEAEPLYRRALEVLRVALGEDHPDYAATLGSLALLLYAIDRHSEAETLCVTFIDNLLYK